MKYVLFETLSGIKKIIDPKIPLTTKRYGTINFTPTTKLVPHKWYDFSFNIYKLQSSPLTNSTHINTKTIQKYAQRKNTRNTHIFRILPLNPQLYFENYKHKYIKEINYMTMPVLAYIQLFFDNALIFDNTKGSIAAFCALYRIADLKIFKPCNDYTFNVLKYFSLENSNDLFVYGDTYDATFDNVVVVGKWEYEEDILGRYERFIGNNILIHVPTKEEAVCIVRIMKSKKNYVGINVIDFFFREWKILENMRPEMRCDVENGYIVHAIKVNNGENQ